MKPKIDIWGAVLVGGVSVLAAMVYFTGKVCGKAEAIGEITDAFKDAIIDAKVENE